MKIADFCLMPLPAQLEPGAGTLDVVGFALRAEFVGVTSPRLEAAAARALAALAAPPVAAAREPLLRIDCRAHSAPLPGLREDEAYRLVVGPAGLSLSAAEEWGILRGLATCTQLLAGLDERDALPCVEISDRPRFPWRGVMLDPARHWLGPQALLRTLDGMALMKLNVLHLHLTDDQAFRFPSAAFPELASEQAFSREDLIHVVKHAANLGIRVVPELDMPGHVTSWLTARPDWGPQTAVRALKAARHFGVHPACLDPSREPVYQAIDTLLGELADVFPDPCVHLGGDEVHSQWWSADEQIGEFMAARGFADAADLQAYFFGRVTVLAAARGKRVIGWDEVLHPGLPPDTIVQSWRGATARNAATRHGCDCVVSANYYLDLFFPADVHYGFDPAASEPALVEREDALLADLRFEHVAAGMAWTRHWRDQFPELPGDPPALRGQVLGGEACLWSELVDEACLDLRLWSRLPAVAERFWSPAELLNVAQLYLRLDACQARLLPVAGIDLAAQQRERLLAAGLPERWLPLAALLEPVKWYGRLLGEAALAARLRGTEMPQARPYDADTPLDRVVDYLLPESPAAGALARLCARADTDSERALAALAAQWCELGSQPDCPRELASCAQLLARLGQLVLDVQAGKVGIVEAGRILDEASRPQGEYLLAPAWPLRGWLAARAAQ